MGFVFFFSLWAFGPIDEVKRLREPKVVDTVAVKGEDRGAETRPIWIHGITNTRARNLTIDAPEPETSRTAPSTLGGNKRPKLQLPLALRKRHPAFHVSLPERYHPREGEEIRLG